MGISNLTLKFALGAIPIVSIPTGIVKHFVHRSDESGYNDMVNNLDLEKVANMTDKAAQKIFKDNLTAEISNLKWYGLLQIIPLVGIYFAWAEKELLEKINTLAQTLNASPAKVNQAEQVNQAEIKINKPSKVTKWELDTADKIKANQAQNSDNNDIDTWVMCNYGGDLKRADAEKMRKFKETVEDTVNNIPGHTLLLLVDHNGEGVQKHLESSLNKDEQKFPYLALYRQGSTDKSLEDVFNSDAVKNMLLAPPDAPDVDSPEATDADE